MLPKARRRLVDCLPERALLALVRARHGELAWQRRIRIGVGLPFASHPTDVAHARLDVPPMARDLQPRAVAKFDAHQVRRETVRTVGRALDDVGIDYLLVPQAPEFGSRIAVSERDRYRALEAIIAGLTGADWAIQGHVGAQDGPSGDRARQVATTSPQMFDRHSGVRVFQLLASESGGLLGGSDLGCVLDFWEYVEQADRPRPDGGVFLPGTHLAPFPKEVFAAYLAPETWHAGAAAMAHWVSGSTTAALFQVRAPIDIVYTWVDGDDPEWLRRRRAFGEVGAANGLNPTATHDSRFVSRDELRYSLRSVAMYASWVRKIFIVTDRQVPDWLDTSHDKVEVVDHSQIFSDPVVLPVFNSHAIESQLHHIPGLSEHYLYLNDDVFFGRLVEPELFFHGNGLGKFFLSAARLDIGPPSSRDLPVMSAAKRNREQIEQNFGATVWNKFQHTPHPQLRSVLEEMERSHPEIFEQVSRSRFRHPDDLSIASALHHYYAYGLGRSVPAVMSYVYQDIGRVDMPRRLSNLLRSRRADAFCLNDNASDPARFEVQRALLTGFLEQYFPVPSPWEKQ